MARERRVLLFCILKNLCDKAINANESQDRKRDDDDDDEEEEKEEQEKRKSRN